MQLLIIYLKRGNKWDEWPNAETVGKSLGKPEHEISLTREQVKYSYKLGL